MSVIEELIVNCFYKKVEFTYSILKIDPSFPNLTVGSDLDIFVSDLLTAQNHIIETASKYLPEQHDIVVSGSENHAYIDIVKGEQIVLRFDLWQRMPSYSRVCVKDAFFYDIIYTSEKQVINDVEVFVPSKINDLIIRYIEFIEWFSERPDKIKHAEYVSKSIEHQVILSEEFFQKFHRIIGFPPFNESIFIGKRENGQTRIAFIINRFVNVFRYLRQFGFIATVKKIINKIR